MPSFEFWHGRDKPALISLLIEKLQANNARIGPSMKAVFRIEDRQGL